MNPAPVITVDGPSGVGKGMVTRALTQRLPGWQRLDSGALYRILALAATQAGVDLADSDRVAALAPSGVAPIGRPRDRRSSRSPRSASAS